MGLIDLTLNIAGLLLWINWRSTGFMSRRRPPVVSLVATLTKAGAGRARRWTSLGSLLGLLLLRALFYWQIGSAVDWTPNLQLQAIALPFRSDYFSRMLIFSFLSFGLVLGMFYCWLLLLSIANRGLPDTDPLQRLVRLHLGWLERWPLGLKLLLPLLLGAACWSGSAVGLARLEIIPPAQSPAHLLQQSLVIGVCAYLSWKHLIVALLGLHVLNSYVYLGNYPFWNYVNATARNLLWPLSGLPLRLAGIDFTPVAGIALIWLAADYGGRGLSQLYLHLPLRV
ncbi:MAG: hypothetical protein KGS61_08755 [Verrucomicrobia bacterium]|nr:hypothetical protein [Verrucomicrobiota bacterium]